MKEKLISSWHFLVALIKIVLAEEESEDGDSSKYDEDPRVNAAVVAAK